ncbi:MAG: hypothetical protein AAGB31_16435, partial [Bdellovibrio sp.]
MLPMLHKHTFITTALLASLTLSACGSKKDVGASAATATTAEQAAQDKKKQKTAKPTPVDTNGQIGTDLPDPSSDENYPPLPDVVGSAGSAAGSNKDKEKTDKSKGGSSSSSSAASVAAGTPRTAVPAPKPTPKV